MSETPTTPTALVSPDTITVLINDSSLRALKPTGTRRTIPDSRIKGLELRLSPDGKHRAWYLRFRSKVDGRPKRLKLGELPEMGLAAARSSANAEKLKIANGKDPRQERIDAKAAVIKAAGHTVGAVLNDYARHVRANRLRTADERLRVLTTHLRSWLHRPISDINREDLRTLLNQIRGDVYATRTRLYLSLVWEFAVEEGVLDANPLKSIKPRVRREARRRKGLAPEERQIRPYTRDELKRFWSNTERMPEPVRVAWRLLLLTGCRAAEGLGLHWQELDLDGGWWSLPAHRSKNGEPHKMPLTELAMQELALVPHTGPRLFTGIKSLKTRQRWNRIAFAGIDAPPKPLHSLRASVATTLSDVGVSVEDVAKLLNHVGDTGNAVTRGYISSTFDVSKRQASNVWNRELRIIVGIDEPPAANVLPFAANRS